MFASLMNGPDLSEDVEMKDSMVSRVMSIHNDPQLRATAEQHGLKIVKVSWEDTDRLQDPFGYNVSSMGNNISDFTLKLSQRKEMCPVIRRPNFQDHRSIMKADKLTVTTEPGQQLPLLTYLMSHVKDAKGKAVNLTAPIDSDQGVIVSSQQCILPLESGQAAFCVKAFNYQTLNPKDPGVLYILASSLGTSPQTAATESQALYHRDKHGKACNMVAMRLKDDRAARGVSLEGEMTAEEQERNMLVIFSVPLKQAPPPPCRGFGGSSSLSFGAPTYGTFGAPSLSSDEAQELALVITPTLGFSERVLQNPQYTSNFSFGEADVYRSIPAPVAPNPKPVTKGMDHAMLSVGAPLFDFPNGPEEVILQRDSDKKIRATVQFYSVTDDGEVDASTFLEIRRKMDNLSKKGFKQLA